MKIWFVIVSVFLFSLNASAEQNRYAKYYLNDTQTPKEIRQAIKAGVVIKGMCPHQAMAAAGMPKGLYRVRIDESVWKHNTSPLKIIHHQCKKPDNSEIELGFRNKTQFRQKEPVRFRVVFRNGRVVLIDRNRISILR